MSRDSYDAVIVGAGFAGLYMLHRLRGLGLSVRVYEAGSGVGGTWFWNRYPGARCDVPSMEYSYQFDKDIEQEWEWSERYATQPEILRYIDWVANRLDLLPDIELNTPVVSAKFDDDAGRWNIETEAGSVSALYCVIATGCLSSTHTPDFEGIDRFEGQVYHTGRWPHEGVDFSGKRVGIIGTGSSAIQSIPIIAAEAEHVTVFQRTATFAVPAHNHPLTPDYQKSIKDRYESFRQANRESFFGLGSDYPSSEEEAVGASADDLAARYQERWEHGGLQFIGAYSDLMIDAEANRSAGEFIRGKITEIVDDSETAKLLSPDQVVGCKRLCVDTGYYETFNRENVSLVDVSQSPIESLTPGGLRTAEREFEFDAVIFATGYDAMTGAILKIDPRGSGGQALSEKWAAGPRTYLGLATAGFPNLFMITGPGSPSVLTNMLPSIEQHVDWIADCIAYLQDHEKSRIDVDVAAEDAWVDRVNGLASFTLFPSCNSWYLGANVPGKPRVFMPYLGFGDYIEQCELVVEKGYEGFSMSADT